MDNEFAKKVGREAFEKLSKQTQALMLECFDHQKWLDTEQAKLDYIYSLAQRLPIYLKYKNGMAEEAEQKIQRAFQTLVIEGQTNMNGNRPTPIASANNNLAVAHANMAERNGNSQSDNNFSLEDDLELSLEGL